jgi:hypothetical protein
MTVLILSKDVNMVIREIDCGSSNESSNVDTGAQAIYLFASGTEAIYLFASGTEAYFVGNFVAASHIFVNQIPSQSLSKPSYIPFLSFNPF